MRFNSKMLSAAAAAVLIVTMAGCESTATSSSKTGGTAVHITNPKGSVTGTVQDTNGNPIKDVEVYLAGQKTKTDAGGIYKFNNVPVTQMFDTGVTANEVGQELSVTIAAPVGYIGATVTVRPAAQIDSAEGVTNGGGDGVAVNAIETFVDGFIASAGVAVLPQTNTTVTGVLRDDTTGSPLADMTVNFEFIAGGTGGIAQEQDQNGVDTTYAVSTYTVTTDANGSFSFTSLPSDSEFDILVPGYTVTSPNANFNSNDETVHTLGNVQAHAILALDTTNPFVFDVNNVIGTVAGTDALRRAVLDDDTRDTFVINFSETIDPSQMELAGNSILVYGGTNGAMSSIDYTAVLDAANRTMTITTTTVLEDGNWVDIFFLRGDVVDTSANVIGAAGPILYDTIKSNYVKVELEIFSEANTNAPAVTAESQLDTDTLGTDDDELIQASNMAFKDVLDETVGFQQLNSADNDTGLVTDAQERLTDLVVALGGTGVLVDKTRVTFTPSGAASYLVSVEDDAGVAQPQGNVFAIANALTTNVDTTAGADFGGTATAELVLLDVADTNPVEVYLSSVQPGDVVTITPMDSLGYTGTPSIITLVDNVPPTTILQKSYYTTNSGDSSGGTVVLFGDGGELADSNGAVTVGTPYLAINNSLLDNLDANGEDASTGVLPNQSLDKELYELSVVDTLGTEKIFLDTLNAYDAQAAASFDQDAALGRKVGVAFSENIGTMGTPTFNGTAGLLSNFTVTNNVVRNVSGGLVNADLITMDATNVMSLANNENLKVIDYVGLTDESNNTATQASVVVKDEMAPMVKTAVYNNNGKVVITFNEDITLHDTPVLDTDGVTVLAPVTTVSITNNAAVTATAVFATGEDSGVNPTWVVTGNTLTVDYTEFTANTMNTNTFWNVSTYAYSDNALYGTTADLDHALVTTEDVSDTHDNSWVGYTNLTGARAVTTPLFGGVFNITNMTNTDNNTNFTGGVDDTTTVDQTVSWTFSHAIRIDQPGDTFTTADFVIANDQYEITTLAAIQAVFEGYDAVATAAVVLTNANGNTILTLSADRKTITLTFTTTTDLAAADSVRQIAGVVTTSDYDTTQNVTGNALTAASN